MNPIRVGVAAACGAFIGAILALSLAHLLWWVGAIAGGLIGWVGYDPLPFFKGATLAVQEAWSKLKMPRPARVKRIMPAWAITHRRFENLGAGLLVCYSTFFIFTLICLVHDKKHNSIFSENSLIKDMVLVGILYAVSVFLGIVAMLAFFLASFLPFSEAQAKHVLANGEEWAGLEVQSAKEGLKYYNPLVAPFMLIYLFYKAVPAIVRFVLTVLVKIYEFTTSDGRIAALLGGSMGASVGYFLHGPIIGLVAGALIGVSLAFMRTWRDIHTQH